MDAARHRHPGLLVLGAWLLIALTLPRRTLPVDEAAGHPPLIIDVLSQLRTEYMGRIQQIEGDYRANRLTAGRRTSN